MRAQSPPPLRSPDSTPAIRFQRRIHEEGRGGIVILQKRRRLSDELACVSTAETSPSLPPLLFPPSLTASMLLLANLRLRRFLFRIPNNDPEGN